MATPAAGVSSVLPYVSWSIATFATIPFDRWEAIYGSLQALKGHIHEYPGLQRFDIYAQIEEDENVRLHCYTTWDTPEQLEAFFERGYTVERMLVDIAGVRPETLMPLEKIF
jgi:hypothetical protein